MQRKRTIYTIGYQKLAPRFLKRLAETLDAIVIDCRYKPVTRKPYHPNGFSRCGSLLNCHADIDS
jgi:hypothetical protein